MEDIILNQDTERNIEDFTDLTGAFGKWHKILVAVLVFTAIISATNILNQPFFAPKIDYWCARPPKYNNMSIEEWKNFSAPIEIRGGQAVYSKCKVYRHIYEKSSNGNLSIVSCSSWEYDHSHFKRTIIEDWNLVCENSWLASFSGSAFFMGYFVSAIVTGHLSDRYGRRTVLIYGTIIHLVFGILCMISPFYWMFVISRFLLSFGRFILFLPFTTSVLESVGPRHRETVLSCQLFGYNIGMLILTGTAWLLKNWYYLQLFCTLPSIILLILWRIIPESPRWLLTRGKLYEAEIVLRKIMKVNEKDTTDLPKSLRFLASKIKADNQKIYTFKDLFHSKEWTKLTLLLCIIWILFVFVTYGITFNADEIGGNIYLLYAIFAVIGFFTSAIIQILLSRIGRKLTIIISFVFTGIFSLLIIAVPSDMIWLRVILIILSKFFINILSGGIYIYTTESYPTIVRNIGIGSCLAIGRIGSILSPFLKESSEKFHWRMPFIIIGVIAIASSLLILPLPETGPTRLKDVLDEVQKFETNEEEEENEV